MTGHVFPSSHDKAAKVPQIEVSLPLASLACMPSGAMLTSRMGLRPWPSGSSAGLEYSSLIKASERMIVTDVRIEPDDLLSRAYDERYESFREECARRGLGRKL